MGQRLYILQILILAVSIAPLQTYATSDGEFAAWVGVRTTWQIEKQLRVIGLLQMRTQNGLKEMERGRLHVGMGYNCFPFLQLEGYYEIQYRNRAAAGWKIGHRYQAGFAMQIRKQRLKFDWRELFQQTFLEGGKEGILRSRLRIRYEPSEWRFHPYFSVELFQPVGGGAFFSLPRVRYRPGMKWKMSQKMALELYYCRQYDVKRCLNVMGVNWEIKL